MISKNGQLLTQTFPFLEVLAKYGNEEQVGYENGVDCSRHGKMTRSRVGGLGHVLRGGPQRSLRHRERTRLIAPHSRRIS